MDRSLGTDDPTGTAAFYANLLTKPMAAGWLIRDASDAVLLVRPAYKAPWEIPGGVVDAGESPRVAARRELLEELGLARRVRACHGGIGTAYLEDARSPR